jgi:hypothetical protein
VTAYLLIGANGLSSSVVALDFALPRSLAYLIAPAVLYLSRKARSTASVTRLSRVLTAQTAISRSAIWTVPRDSSRNVLYQPRGLTLQDLTNTRSFTTTTQIPIKRCAPVPARICTPLFSRKSARMSYEKHWFAFTPALSPHSSCLRVPAPDRPHHHLKL